MPNIELKPETIGALIGGAFIAIATALGIIRQWNGKKGKTDEYKAVPSEGDDAVGDVLDIAQDYRRRLEALEEQARADKADCEKQIQLLVKDYDGQLTALRKRIAELERVQKDTE